MRLLVAAPDHFTFAEPMQMSVLAAGIRDAGERRVARAAVARALRRFGLDAIRQAFRLCRRERAQGGPRSRTCSTRSCAASSILRRRSGGLTAERIGALWFEVQNKRALGRRSSPSADYDTFCVYICTSRPRWNWRGKAAVGGTKKSLSTIIDCIKRAILLNLLPRQAGATYAVRRTARVQ